MDPSVIDRLLPAGLLDTSNEASFDNTLQTYSYSPTVQPSNNGSIKISSGGFPKPRSSLVTESIGFPVWTSSGVCIYLKTLRVVKRLLLCPVCLDAVQAAFLWLTNQNEESFHQHEVMQVRLKLMCQAILTAFPNDRTFVTLEDNEHGLELMAVKFVCKWLQPEQISRYEQALELTKQHSHLMAGKLKEATSFADWSLVTTIAAGKIDWPTKPVSKSGTLYDWSDSTSQPQASDTQLSNYRGSVVCPAAPADLKVNISDETATCPFKDRPASQEGQGTNMNVQAALPRTLQGTKGAVHNIRYKTQLCIHYRRLVQCPAGDECHFAHGTQELRTPHTHPRYRTQKCSLASSSTGCPYGTGCFFKHD